MRRIKNPYKSSILDLNMICLEQDKRVRFHATELVALAVPVCAIALILFANFQPEVGFLAQCQNIPGGDFCSITAR